MFGRLRNIFLAGLAVLVPLAATLYFTWLIFRFADGILGRFLVARLQVPPPPGLGILLTLAIIMFTGLLASNLMGRRLIGLGEALLGKTPVVRNIYVAFKQITEAFMQGEGTGFRRVVLVQYPREGLYALGLVTGRTSGEFVDKTGRETLNVFIPTTPNPTSGYLVLVPREEVIFLDLSVEDGMKLIISGGVVDPKAYRAGPDES